MGLISESSNSVRSFIKPALHPLEQIFGGLGWRACAGSAGVFAGSTTKGGCEGGHTLAQPLTSSASGVSVIASLIELSLGFIGNLLSRLGAALFFGASVFDGLARGALALCELGRVLLDRLGVLALLIGQPHGLPTQQPDQDRHDGGPSHPRAKPGHHADTFAVRARAMSLATSQSLELSAARSPGLLMKAASRIRPPALM